MMIYLLLCEQSNILIIKDSWPMAKNPNTFDNHYNKKANPMGWVLNIFK
jgi:hypothetical protein